MVATAGRAGVRPRAHGPYQATGSRHYSGPAAKEVGPQRNLSCRSEQPMPGIATNFTLLDLCTQRLEQEAAAHPELAPAPVAAALQDHAPAGHALEARVSAGRRTGGHRGHAVPPGARETG
jgi:hypothetical protein